MFLRSFLSGFGFVYGYRLHVPAEFWFWLKYVTCVSICTHTQPWPLSTGWLRLRRLTTPSPSPLLYKRYTPLIQCADEQTQVLHLTAIPPPSSYLSPSIHMFPPTGTHRWESLNYFNSIFDSSSKIELQLYSPSLKVYSEDGRGPMAVFSEHDQVGGKVTLDSSCGNTGRLSVSVCMHFCL